MLLIPGRSILCSFWHGSITSNISIKLSRIVAVQYIGSGANIQGYNPQDLRKHSFQAQTLGIIRVRHSYAFFGSGPYFSWATLIQAIQHRYSPIFTNVVNQHDPERGESKVNYCWYFTHVIPCETVFQFISYALL